MCGVKCRIQSGIRCWEASVADGQTNLDHLRKGKDGWRDEGGKIISDRTLYGSHVARESDNTARTPALQCRVLNPTQHNPPSRRGERERDNIMHPGL